MQTILARMRATTGAAGAMWIALLVAALPLCAHAQGSVLPAQQEKIRQANAECFSCHSPEGLKAPPKDGLDLQ